MIDKQLTLIQNLDRILKNRHNFETAILYCSSKETEIKKIISRNKNKYSQKIIRNIEIYSNCLAFTDKFNNLINDIQLDISNKLDNVSNRDDKINYIIEKLKQLDAIILNTISIYKTYNNKSLEGTINIACKYIEFNKISQPDNIKQDRTEDDVINTCLEFAEKINENKHLLDELVPFFENVNEDEFYINLIIYCKEEIRKLHGKIVFDNFEEAEIIKTMKLVEIEGFSIAQYNPCNETLTKQTETRAEQPKPEIKPVFKTEEIQTMFDLLKDRFPDQQKELKQVLETGKTPVTKLLFHGNGKTLLDFFKQLMQGQLLTIAVQKNFEKWVSDGFEYLYRGKRNAIKLKYASKIISGNERAAKGNRLIDVKTENGKFKIIQLEIENRKQN